MADTAKILKELKERGYTVNEHGIYFPKSIEELEGFPMKLVALRKRNDNWYEYARGFTMFGETQFRGNYAVMLMEEERLLGSNVKGTCIAWTTGGFKEPDTEAFIYLKELNPTVFLVYDLRELSQSKKTRPNARPARAGKDILRPAPPRLHPASKTTVIQKPDHCFSRIKTKLRKAYGCV